VTDGRAPRPSTIADDALDQIFISYQPAEDRLLMRLGTVGRAEVRLWLTRRFLKELWAALVTVIENDEAVLSRADESGRRALLAFRHEQALAQCEFSREAAEATTHPMGDAPLLLTRLSLSQDSTLRLADAAGRGIEFALSLRLAHSLARLLADGLRDAGWDLVLNPGEGAPRNAVAASLN
jgi:hypothetical protein